MEQGNLVYVMVRAEDYRKYEKWEPFDFYQAFGKALWQKKAKQFSLKGIIHNDDSESDLVCVVFKDYPWTTNSYEVKVAKDFLKGLSYWEIAVMTNETTEFDSDSLTLSSGNSHLSTAFKLFKEEQGAAVNQDYLERSLVV